MAVKLYLILGAVLAVVIGGILAHDHYLSRQLKASRAATADALGKLESERKNRKIEADDRKRNDETDKSLQTTLGSIAGPDPTVSVPCFTPKLPRAASQGNAAPVVADPTGDGGTGSALSDLGPAIEAVRVEAQRNNARAIALQAWEVARTH